MLKNPVYYEDANGSAIDYFMDGKLGVYCGGGQYGQILKDALGDDLGVTTLPTIKIDNEDTQLGGFTEYYAFGVNFNTKYPKEAQELAEWLGGEKCQMMRYEQQGVIPTLTALYEEEMIKNDEVVAAVVSQIKHCVVAPSITKMSLYWDAATALGTEMINGSVTEDNLQQKLDIVVENITFEFEAE